MAFLNRGGSKQMQPQISTPPRSIYANEKNGAVPKTPVDSGRRINFSFSAPTQKQKRLDGNNSTFVMSNSSGKSKVNSRRVGNVYEGSLIDDEESVLVASPFAYVTPPMPPRDEVSNTKTTRAMAKIVEEVGTPDSVIRKLSFMNPMTSSSSSFEEDRPPPGTVNRTARVKSVDSDQELGEDSFRYPIATPSQDMSCTEIEMDSSSEGYARFSLSMVDLYPPQSPKLMRPNASFTRGESGEQGTVPDMLTNCPGCGKQFISGKHLEDHSGFCRPDSRSRVGNSEASTLAQTTDTALATVRGSHFSSLGSLASTADIQRDSDVGAESAPFTESPALPLYVQRALAAASPLPAVAPLPLPPSPSILASPTELRESNDEDYLEEEISTFLECLRSDVRQTNAPAIEKEAKRSRQVEQPCSGSSSDGSIIITDRQKLWASRRRGPTRIKSEHSLCVSSDDDFCPASSHTGLVFVPAAAARQPSPPPPPQLPPPVPMTSNISCINSPIPERCSFDQDASISASFLVAGGALNSSPPSVPGLLQRFAPQLVRQSVPPSTGRFSPTFGRASLASVRSSDATPSVTDSAMTLMRMSIASANGIRFPCSTCGRKFGTPSRLERHEHVCQQVFKKPVSSPVSDTTAPTSASVKHQSTSLSDTSMTDPVSCRYCARNFSHPDKLRRHEHICLSVFSGTKTARVRSGSRTPSTSVVESSDKDTSVRTTVTPVKRKKEVVKKRPTDSRSMMSCDMVTIVGKGTTPPSLRTQSFVNACVLAHTAPTQIPRRTPMVSVGVQSGIDTVPAFAVDRSRYGLSRETSRSSSESQLPPYSGAEAASFSSSLSSSVNRTSLEFQYQLLRDQIRSCSERLKQRQRTTTVRDG